MMRAPTPDAVISRIPLLVRTVLAILILCGALGAMIEGRARILRSGSEVRLKTAPVDPRDLFRGDYVVLNYEIGTVEVAPGAVEPPYRRGETVHVRLARDPDGFARATGVSRDRPAVTGSENVIAGRILSTGACFRTDDGGADCARGRNGLRIAYGLESYFVPQGSGRAIERTDRKRIEVVAAVSASGDAAIKRLLIDGQIVHAEPPY